MFPENYFLYVVLMVGLPVSIWLAAKGQPTLSGLLTLSLFGIEFYLDSGTESVLTRSSVSNYREIGKNQAGTIFPLLEAYQEVRPESAQILLFTYGDLTNLMKMHTDEELQDKILQETLRFFSGNILSANADSIHPYLRTHLKFLQELYDINPVLVNQFHFPQFAGAFKAGHIRSLHSHRELLKGIKLILASKGNISDDMYAIASAANTWMAYREAFFKKHPEHAAVLKRISTITGPEGHKKLADAILAYLNGMLSINPSDARGALSHFFRDF